MKTKFIFSVFFASSFLFISCKQKTTNYSSSIDITGKDTLLYDVYLLDTTNTACTQQYKNCPSVKVSYPIFHSPDSSLNTYLNEEVMKSILYFDVDDSVNYTSVIDIAKRFFEENLKMKKEGNYDDASSGWTKENSVYVYDKLGKYLTLEVLHELYAGGAHPNSYIEYKVYDLVNRKQAQASEILNLNDTSLLRIGEHLFRKQNEIADSSTLADAGYFIFGDGDNFEDGPNYGKFHFNNNMAITKDGIQFLYNAYEMAPYAAGRPSITLPYDMLQPYLKVKIW
ncbi:MAG: hypothetical protein RJA25_611 [Bacteroidota bacterium]|jgi:hypothetical protein